MDSDLIAGIGFWALLACALASLIWPWLTPKDDRCRRALSLASGATVLFVLYNLATASKYNIRIDLCLSIPAILATWANYLVIVVKTRDKQP
jgi:hypothetical protein